MKNQSSSNIFGIILIVLGTLWFLSLTTFFNFDVWDYFWPAAFMTVGIVLAIRGKALFIAALFIFFGGLNLACHIFNYSFDFLFENFWPILLIVAGVLILARKRDHHNKIHDFPKNCSPFNQPDSNSEFTPYTETAPNSGNEQQTGSANYCGSNHSHFHGFGSSSSNPLDVDKIDEVAILTSLRKYVTSKNFKGGSVSTILGGGIVDLSGAKLAEGDNILEITSIMGGVTFRVPHDWKVIVNVHSIFGGFEDKRRYFNQDEPTGNSTLIIKGTVIMGGGTVTY